jgi:predicted nucleotide-binding protein
MTDSNQLLQVLEKCSPQDFLSVVSRIPGARSHIPSRASQVEKASLLISYCTSISGPGLEALADALAELKMSAPVIAAKSDRKKVFVVYGRNEDAYTAIKLFLNFLGLEPLTFEEVKNDLGGSPFVGQIVKSGMDRARGIIVLFTPDEYASLDARLRNSHDADSEAGRVQARQNVTLEAGMALAIDESRTILVVIGNPTLPSDLHGRHYLRMNNTAKARIALRDALVGIRCEIKPYLGDISDKVLAGDFDAAVKSKPELRTDSVVWPNSS